MRLDQQLGFAVFQRRRDLSADRERDLGHSQPFVVMTPAVQCEQPQFARAREHQTPCMAGNGWPPKTGNFRIRDFSFRTQLVERTLEAAAEDDCHTRHLCQFRAKRIDRCGYIRQRHEHWYGETTDRKQRLSAFHFR